jgi:hypothetical protein
MTRAAGRDTAGVAIALTVFSTVRRWGLLELPLFFLYLSRVRNALDTLKKLSFIHAARWSILRVLPANGSLPERRLRYPHLYFESNFNGGWEEYIDAFSFVLAPGMWLFWGSSYGFPKAVPPGPFKQYIRSGEYPASHYYSAYPEATATMALSALELRPHLEALRARAPQMTPEQFAEAWQAFITDHQSCL